MIRIIGLGIKNNLENIDELKDDYKIYLRKSEILKIKELRFIKDKLILLDGGYEEIADIIIQKASERNINIDYLCLGNPLLDDSFVSFLLKKCKTSGIDYCIFKATGFMDFVVEKFCIDNSDGVTFADAHNDIRSIVSKRNNNLLVNSFDRVDADELTKELLKIYRPDFKVYYHDYFCEKNIEVKNIKDLDDFNFIYIPKVQSDNNIGEMRDIYDLFDLVKILRSENGCPWDKEQDHKSIENSMIEESYEVVDAIECNNIEALQEELGDVLFQIVFHVSLEDKKNTFEFNDVVKGVYDKMVYRHPHVFGNCSADNTEEVLKNWEVLKNKEKSLNTMGEELEAIAKCLPALIRANKVQKKVSKVGFDFKDVNEAALKVIEELKEVKEVYNESNMARITEEVGDLLFSVVNISRLLEIDPEEALRKSTEKFISRFKNVELEATKSNTQLNNLSINEMNNLWEKAKNLEK